MLAAVAPAARADGDPASDVLAVQRIFLPSDANIPLTEQLQLSSMLARTARDGYPLRVAIIASATDLGSVTELWRRPETYAHFLGEELALVYHGSVLVVMPNGYGVDVTAGGTRTASGQAELQLPGRRLGAAALAAVQRLASSAGAPVRAPTVSAPTATRPAPALPWLVFGLGLLPLAVCWWLSLRRKPLALRAREP